MASLLDVVEWGLALVCVVVCNRHMANQMEDMWLDEVGMIQEQGNENSQELELLNYQTSKTIKMEIKSTNLN